jgi:hypothetical protein
VQPTTGGPRQVLRYSPDFPDLFIFHDGNPGSSANNAATIHEAHLRFLDKETSIDLRSAHVVGAGYVKLPTCSSTGLYYSQELVPPDQRRLIGNMYELDGETSANLRLIIEGLRLYYDWANSQKENLVLWDIGRVKPSEKGKVSIDQFSTGGILFDIEPLYKGCSAYDDGFNSFAPRLAKWERVHGYR